MPDEIRQFLLEFKNIVTSGSGVELVPRRNIRPTLIELGLTKNNIEEILLSLSVTDYCKGPEADRDRIGELWFFGKVIQDKEIYIKLKIADVGGIKIAKCISFHIAEYPMSFPYK